MEHFSGVCLLIMAFIHGGTIIYEMVQHYPLRH
jgi:hypothetical protein